MTTRKLENCRATDGCRWFQLWIGIGLVLAVLLLVSSISTYLMVSRRVIVDHVRSDLAAQVAMMDQQVQRGAVQNPSQFASMVQQVEDRSNKRIAWIQVRANDGATVAHAGFSAAPAFSNQDIRLHLGKRRPIYKTLNSATGQLVVEVFPFRLPHALKASELPGHGDPGGAPRFDTVEIGAFLEGAGVALWPLKRNLMIDFSAALMLLISLAAIAIRLRSYVAGRRLEQEVEIARTVQRDLLPSAKRELEGFDLAADCMPAARVTGEFYDSFSIRSDRPGFVLGDVSGKGLPAALLMGVIHGAVRSSNWTESATNHQEASQQLNRLLCERAATERFATMFWSYFDSASQHLKYINAGHCPPLLVKASQRNITLRLTIGGPVLGLLPNAEFQQGSVRLEPGDVLVLYSDGIVEAANAEDEEFGVERVLAIVRNHAKNSAEEIRDLILSAVEAFTGRVVPEDDRTLFVIIHTGAATRIESHEWRANRKAAARAA